MLTGRKRKRWEAEVEDKTEVEAEEQDDCQVISSDSASVSKTLPVSSKSLEDHHDSDTGDSVSSKCSIESGTDAQKTVPKPKAIPVSSKPLRGGRIRHKGAPVFVQTDSDMSESPIHSNDPGPYKRQKLVHRSTKGSTDPFIWASFQLVLVVAFHLFFFEIPCL
jgi:hypothetical protein